MKLLIWEEDNVHMYEKYDNNIKDIIDAQNGDEKAMENLINNNSGLIWSILNRFKDRGYELDDLYQIAMIGFIKCIKKFDTNYDVRLSTYAVPYILGEIKRFIRDDGPIKVSRSIKELAIRIKEVQKEYMKKYGRDIKIEELSKILKTPKEELTLAIEAFNPVESIYSASYSNDDDEISVIDKLSTNVDEEMQVINKISIRQLIDGLSERDKQVIMLRYYKSKTQTEVAKILGITQVQVSRIEKQILESMKKKIYK